MFYKKMGNGDLIGKEKTRRLDSFVPSFQDVPILQARIILPKIQCMKKMKKNRFVTGVAMSETYDRSKVMSFVIIRQVNLTFFFG